MSGKYQYLRDGQWTAHSDGVTTDTNGLGKATKSLLSIGVALAVIILLALAISNPEFALSIIAQYVSF